MQLLSKVLKEAGWQIPNRGFLSDASTMPDMTTVHSMGHKGSETIFPYQICSALSNQRHKRHLIHASSNVLERYTFAVEFSRFMSTIDTSKGGPVKEAGGRLGKLDSANEAGMFHKVNKSKLEQFKKTFKDKPVQKKATPDPAAKPEE